MSTDKRHLIPILPTGSGTALDLGGGDGAMGPIVRDRGFTYVNVDLKPRSPDSAVAATAEALPLADKSISLIVSVDSLEHFPDPRAALREARRVLMDDGRMVVWVPFLHPFHGDDFFRFTPLGLQHLARDAGFLIDRLEAPLGIFSIVAQMIVLFLKKLRLGALEGRVERVAESLDRAMRRPAGASLGYAAAYRMTLLPASRNEHSK